MQYIHYIMCAHSDTNMCNIVLTAALCFVITKETVTHSITDVGLRDTVGLLGAQKRT